MNIKLERLNEIRLREMLRKNYRYESFESIVNEAISSFYVDERKRGFR